MIRLGKLAIVFLPAIVLVVIALRPYTHRDFGFLAMPFGLPVIFLTWLVFIFAAETKRPILKTTWPLLLSSTLIISIWITDWPLHLAFKWAKPDLDRLAAQFARNEKPPLPQRAGPFLIRDGGVIGVVDKAETPHIRRGTYLTVITDAAGPTRFVHAKSARGFNLWSETKLAPDWFLIRED